MAQGTLTLFNEFSEQFTIGTHAFPNGNSTRYKVMLITNATVPTAATATPVKGDFTEVSGGTEYTAGGEAVTIAISRSTNVTTVDFSNNITWSQDGSGPTNIYYAVIYNEDATSDEAVGFIDMTADGGTTPISLQAGDITITWGASGVFTVTV